MSADCCLKQKIQKLKSKTKWEDISRAALVTFYLLFLFLDLSVCWTGVCGCKWTVRSSCGKTPLPVHEVYLLASHGIRTSLSRKAYLFIGETGVPRRVRVKGN